jgi:hypothetical protein
MHPVATVVTTKRVRAPGPPSDRFDILIRRETRLREEADLFTSTATQQSVGVNAGATKEI